MVEMFPVIDVPAGYMGSLYLGVLEGFECLHGGGTYE